jgi:hypothetical protein
LPERPTIPGDIRTSERLLVSGVALFARLFGKSDRLHYHLLPPEFSAVEKSWHPPSFAGEVGRDGVQF